MFRKLAPIFEIWTRLNGFDKRLERLEYLIEEMSKSVEQSLEVLHSDFKNIPIIHTLDENLIAYFKSRDEDMDTLKKTVNQLIDYKINDK